MSRKLVGRPVICREICQHIECQNVGPNIILWNIRFGYVTQHIEFYDHQLACENHIFSKLPNTFYTEKFWALVVHLMFNVAFTRCNYGMGGVWTDTGLAFNRTFCSMCANCLRNQGPPFGKHTSFRTPLPMPESKNNTFKPIIASR